MDIEQYQSLKLTLYKNILEDIKNKSRHAFILFRSVLKVKNGTRQLLSSWLAQLARCLTMRIGPTIVSSVRRDLCQKLISSR